MKNLIMSLLKLIPIHLAIEIILNYFTEYANKTKPKWDDKAVKMLWELYSYFKNDIPDHLKVAINKQTGEKIA